MDGLAVLRRDLTVEVGRRGPSEQGYAVHQGNGLSAAGCLPRMLSYRNMQKALKIVSFGMLVGMGILLPLSSNAMVAWSDSLEQWGIQEVELKSDQVYANPFSDVKLEAEFSNDGRSVKVDGFYDGDSTWRIRLMPDRQGTWTFKTISNDHALDGISGQFVVSSPLEGNHGPVRVAKTYHFSYADGTPYFLLGTTCYQFLSGDSDVQSRSVANLREAGFSKVRFMAMPMRGMPTREKAAMSPYVLKADGSIDFEQFDPKYFVNMEKGIRDLQAANIEADVILFHPYGNSPFGKMDEDHNIAYVRYIVARLSAFRNVWWTMANEYDLLSERDWKRLGETVQSCDQSHHLVGIHPFLKWYDAKEPWLSHTILQDGSPYSGRTAAIGRMRYAKPTVVDEYGYEGNLGQFWGQLSAPEVVNRHWDITMAGGYGSHGESYVRAGGRGGGYALVGDSYKRLAFLRSVISELPFQDLSPSPELVVNGAALASVGKAYLFYFPWEEERIWPAKPQIRLAGADLFKVEVIDPWLMTIFLVGYTMPGDYTFDFTPRPGLLRIVAANRGEGTPASIASLLARQTVWPSSPEEKADPALFVSPKLHYRADFPIAQLQQNPAARVVIEKLLPKAVFEKKADYLPLDTLAAIMDVSPVTVHEIDLALEKIPVD